MVNEISITVAYVSNKTSKEIALRVQNNTTIQKALITSGILAQFPEIDLKSTNKVGIFGKLHDLEHIVNDGDRIEIYRPLHLSPMEARKVRAKAVKVSAV